MVASLLLGGRSVVPGYLALCGQNTRPNLQLVEESRGNKYKLYYN